jgi:signal transduction histidine kinase
MERFARSPGRLHGTWVAGLVVAVWGGFGTARAAEVTIKEVRVDGRPVAIPAAESAAPAVRIPSTARQVQVRCVATDDDDARPGAQTAPAPESGLEPPQGTRLRYRLDALDQAWRDVPGKFKADILFDDGSAARIGSKEHLIELDNRGWKGTPDASTWKRHVFKAEAPPRARSVLADFITAPNPENVGIVAIDDVVLTIERPGRADPIRHELTRDLGIAGDAFHPLARPKGWQRLGSKSEISQVRMRSQPQPHPILVLVDDDSKRYGNWATQESFPVEPGDLVTLEWSMAATSGRGGELVADYGRLEPGRYLFRAELAQPGGEPTGIESSVAIEVYVPFHLRRDVWAGAGILGVAAVATGVRAAGVRRMKRRLREIEREHTLEQERARIARDLHDDVGAGLTEIAVQTDWLRRDVERLAATHTAEVQEAGILDRAGRVCASAVELIRSVDAIVWAVNPENDTLDRFVGYLTHSAAQFAQSAGITIRLDVPDDIPATPLSGRVRHNVLLIVREALNNVVKHAGAKVVRVRVTIDTRQVAIGVEDDGQGFDVAAASGPHADGRHAGLDNMRRRAEDIGGRLRIDSRHGGGTRVEIAAPLA